MSTKQQTVGKEPRWVDLNHELLWQRAFVSMSPGSRERAHEDSIRHVLRGRLPKMENNDHFRYIEYECARIVELLRALRDEYRTHLEAKGCKPTAEMYTVVFHLAVIPYAAKILRSAMLDYIVRSHVDHIFWEALFGMIPLPDSLPPPALRTKEKSWEVGVKGTLESLTGLGTVTNLTGGLFGREGQVVIGRRRPWPHVFVFNEMTFTEHLEKRQRLWDECQPWTEGLARLFDATQEELLFQDAILPQDDQRAELRLTELPAFQRIVFEHLYWLPPGTRSRRHIGPEVWIPLARQLDQEVIPLSELDPTGLELRRRLQSKNYVLDTWEQCFNDKAVASFENGKSISMGRAVKRTLHNALKKAEARIGVTSTKLAGENRLGRLSQKRITKGPLNWRVARTKG